MKYFVLTLMFCLVTSAAYIETIITTYNQNPVGVAHCHSAATGPMRKGEELSLEGQCRKATCEENGRIIVRKCKNIPMSPCGIEAADFTQPFPLCCPQPKSCSTKN